MMGHLNPPRHGEGDHAKHGGGGSPQLHRPETHTARKLRRYMSLPEVLLWQRLRGNQLGVKFRRQHPIGSYVADFYCSSQRLVIEVDGDAHNMGDRPARDVSRDAFLNENGYKVLRVAASDILKDIDPVMAAIAAIVDSPLHHQPAAGGPPPRAGEENKS
jgi:very-short-patch-repair endonuclease